MISSRVVVQGTPYRVLSFETDTEPHDHLRVLARAQLLAQELAQEIRFQRLGVENRAAPQLISRSRPDAGRARCYPWAVPEVPPTRTFAPALGRDRQRTVVA